MSGERARGRAVALLTPGAVRLNNRGSKELEWLCIRGGEAGAPGRDLLHRQAKQTSFLRLLPQPMDDPEKTRLYLSGREAERYFQRHEMLLEFVRLFDYKQASDRAVAIIGAAFVDTLLRDILIEFMVEDEKEVSKLLQPEGPLGTYGSRVTACYCFGLIGKIVTADLRLVGKIRNSFAHDILVADFSDQKISQWCRALRWHKEAFAVPPPNATDRDLFQVGVNQLVTHLNGVPSIARLSKRSEVLGT
jgi:DNA-binding MltR family transcriptional regulator